MAHSAKPIPTLAFCNGPVLITTSTIPTNTIHTVSNSRAQSLHRTYDGPISTTTFTFGRSAGRRARNCSSFLASTCHAKASKREKRGYGINSTRVIPASGRTCSSPCNSRGTHDSWLHWSSGRGDTGSGEVSLKSNAARSHPSHFPRGSLPSDSGVPVNEECCCFEETTVCMSCTFHRHAISCSCRPHPRGRRPIPAVQSESYLPIR